MIFSTAQQHGTVDTLSPEEWSAIFHTRKKLLCECICINIVIQRVTRKNVSLTVMSQKSLCIFHDSIATYLKQSFGRIHNHNFAVNMLPTIAVKEI